MPVPLQIHLSEEDDRRLEDLSYSNQVRRRSKQRATALRLNACGWNVKQVAEYLDWAEQIVRDTIHRWQQQGIEELRSCTILNSRNGWA